jgi:hypothetical protein
VTIERDRANAIKAVEAASAEGEIIPADRDKRVEQLRQAQTQTEIDLVLGRLRHRVQVPVPPPGPVINADRGSGRSLPIVALVGGLVSVVAAIAVVVFLVNLLSGVDNSPPTSGPSPTRATESRGTPAAADGLSVQGFQDLLAAVKSETGTTKVFDATLYPAYAVLQLPVDRETSRQSYYYWDGRKLKANDVFGKSSNPRLDLSTVNAEAMLRLSHRVRRIVEEPTSWYVILRAPDSDKAVMYAYASNKFSEGGYLSADADGKQIRNVTW